MKSIKNKTTCKRGQKKYKIFLSPTSRIEKIDRIEKIEVHVFVVCISLLFLLREGSVTT